MGGLPEAYGVIPARYASSRFPGKPLAKILGKPMFVHVYERASRCRTLKRVVLATDDDRIAAAAESYGVPWVMTSADHASGTDRVREAADLLGVREESVVVNIQGDEPALDPAMLDELLAPFADPQVRVTTLARTISEAEAQSPDRVKTVLAASGDALYFSRSLIPHRRDHDGADFPYLLHIGLYAFRMETLRRFTSLPEGRLEGVEKLEQLRLLEAGIPIRVSVTERRCLGVDRPEDLVEAERIIAEESI